MWKLDASERIARWRDFRNSIENLPLDEALYQTMQFWNSAPFTPYYLDPLSLENWPDPWTLIYENYYCDVAKVLGIVYTIVLTEHKKNLDIEIRVYKDPNTRHEYNLAWINQGKYIVNLIDNEIVNNTQFDKNLKLVKSYTATELQIEKYNN